MPQNRRTAARRPGRPSEGAGVSRDALLDAAAQLFAHRGIAATSLREVAENVGATPALVHYYFGSKERLAEAVLTERVAPVLMKATAPLRESPLLEPQALVQSYVSTIAQAPWVPQLMMREVLSEGGALREFFLAHVGAPMSQIIPARLAAAQKAGVLRADLDPRLVGLSIMSLMIFPFLSAPVWRVVLGLEPGPALTARLIDHLCAVLRHGVEPSHESKK